jgi:hypothetical protein
MQRNVIFFAFFQKKTACGRIFHAKAPPNGAYCFRAAKPPKGGLTMPKKLIDTEMNPSEIYPDPLGRAKGSAITNPIADIALAGDLPASRLFSNLPAALARDMREEVRREWEEHRPSARG